MARFTALSVYWGLYGLGLIGVGFLRRSAPTRYAGLALLIITLVMVVGLSFAVAAIYGFISLGAIGLLLIVTSIAYVRLAPRLLGRADAGQPRATQ